MAVSDDSGAAVVGMPLMPSVSGLPLPSVSDPSGSDPFVSGPSVSGPSVSGRAVSSPSTSVSCRCGRPGRSRPSPAGLPARDGRSEGEGGGETDDSDTSGSVMKDTEDPEAEAEDGEAEDGETGVRDGFGTLDGPDGRSGGRDGRDGRDECPAAGREEVPWSGGDAVPEGAEGVP